MVTRKVLVVDDDSCVRDLVALSLETTTDWEIKISTSAKQGLEAAIAEPPDVILLDVCMPEMDGFAFLQALQSHHNINQIPVIFLTASGDLVKQMRPKHRGQLELIAKPFNPFILAQQIVEVLSWHDSIHFYSPNFAV